MSDYWQPGVRLGEAIGVLGQKTCSRFLKKIVISLERLSVKNLDCWIFFEGIEGGVEVSGGQEENDVGSEKDFEQV